MKRHITLLATLLVLTGTAAMAQDYVPTPVTVSTEKVKLNGKVYLAHPVLERQTLYSIAKAYGVTEQDLYEANPSLRDTGLQKGSILLVPTDRQAAAQLQPAPAPGEQQVEYKEHTVRWYEDIDDIARRYNISVQEIIDFNQLKSRKLSTRQVLRIPVRAEGVPVILPVEPVQAPEDTLATGPAVTGEEEEKETPADPFLFHRPKDQVEFTLLLPLQSGQSTAEANLDFYSGVLMALRDLETEGLKVNMHVHDLYSGMPDAEALCKGDFVLGPVASRDIEVILQMVDGRVPLVSPLDQKAASLAINYRQFIQAPAGAVNQYEDLARWVQEDLRSEDRILFVSEKNAGNSQAAVSIRTAMAGRQLDYRILNYAVSAGRAVPDTLAQCLVKDGVNRVVVASESEAFVGDVVRNLGIMLGKGYDIVMYAPSKVRSFDSIDGTALHDVSSHISTAYHVNYGSPEVDQFVRTYRALFNTEPSQFAFQGYDTARYFVSSVARYGHSWAGKLDRERSRGLHTDFLFEADGNDGCRNTAVRRIIYQPDYTTVLLH